MAITLSSCHNRVPDIIHVGDCEHGIVTQGNIEEIRKTFKEVKPLDVLISGGCYQEHFIQKR